MSSSNEIGKKIARASRVGDVAFLEGAFASDMDVLKVTESEKWNYLHKANLSKASPADTIKFFIENGVPVNAQDMYGMTPLHYAVREKNIDAIRLLLEAGANPNLQNQDGDHALRQAVLKLPREEDLPIFELLVEHGVDINKPNNNGVTTLDVLRMGTKRPQSVVDYLEEAEQKQLNV